MKYLFGVAVALLIASYFIIFKSNSASLNEIFSPGNFLQEECKIIDREGRIVKNLPYGRCLFLSDGRFITMTEWQDISLFEKDGRNIWKKNLPAHHYMTLCRNDSAVAVIYAADGYYKGEFAKFDNVSIFRIEDGALIAEWKMSDFLSDLVGSPDIADMNYFGSPGDSNLISSVEFSHANSIEEISNSNQKWPFVNGNFVFNAHGSLNRFMVLSYDLKRILWISKGRYNAHSLSLSADGNLLFLNNQKEILGNRYSSLQKINPFTEETTWEFVENPITDFFSKILGSVFEGPGYLVYSETSLEKPGTMVRIIDSSGRRLWSGDRLKQESANTMGFGGLLRIQISRLDLFLKNSSF